ncbi:hypothetical protein [Natrinema halophilum]|uniref:Uncharacterized protein n=1 Tax=Natrinema halophilum TaxID=1699371 RepID=A0A7D5KF61_9EURY|nr:hypothetical protein [Natrinema halophilum]QLG50876.1 hypothetical protein HYG82_19565 [Natrinema halophilum]
MSEKKRASNHSSADSAETIRTEDGIGHNRRAMMKLAAGTGASALALPGLATADRDSNSKNMETTSRGPSQKPPQRRYKWVDEEYLVDPEDRNKDGWVEFETGTTEGISLQSHNQDPGQRTFGGELGVKGLSITLEAVIGDCEGEFTVGALGQSTTHTLTCSNACQKNRLDGGVAYIEYDICYDWDVNELTYEVKSCTWHFTGWSCGHKKIESFITK